MADFEWIPNYPVETTVEYVTRVSEGETGAERRRSKRTDPIYRYKLRFDRTTTTVANAIEALFVSKKGKGTTFTWLQPTALGGSTITVRFDDDALGKGYYRYGRWQFEVGFRKI